MQPSALVFRLGHVIEAGIIHDGGRHAHALYEAGLAQRVDRIGDAGAHVVRQAQGVAYLVSGHEADELAHDRVVEFHLAGGRVDGGRLYEVPIAQQVHHVVVPENVALQDLAGAGVVDVRSLSVLNVGGDMADHGVADIFRTPV